MNTIGKLRQFVENMKDSSVNNKKFSLKILQTFVVDSHLISGSDHTLKLEQKLFVLLNFFYLRITFHYNFSIYILPRKMRKLKLNDLLHAVKQ